MCVQHLCGRLWRHSALLSARTRDPTANACMQSFHNKPRSMHRSRTGRDGTGHHNHQQPTEARHLRSSRPRRLFLSVPRSRVAANSKASARDCPRRPAALGGGIRSTDGSPICICMYVQVSQCLATNLSGGWPWPAGRELPVCDYKQSFIEIDYVYVIKQLILIWSFRWVREKHINTPFKLDFVVLPKLVHGF